jgi:E3 ubiquitin-protein ligase NEDD4
MDVLDETFSVTEDCFSEHVVVELRPGGANLPVMEVNREDYVGFVVAHRIVGCISEQFCAFMDGLGDVLLLELMHIFDEHELELLIGGMTEIDMDDWTRFTDYRRYEKLIKDAINHHADTMHWQCGVTVHRDRCSK